MNNRILGALAGVLSVALLAILGLFFTTTQTLSDTEESLAQARRTGTAFIATDLVQGTSTQAAAEAALQLATTSADEQTSALATAQAQATVNYDAGLATQTALASDLSASQRENENLIITATEGYEAGVAAAETQTDALNATQSALVSTATMGYQEQVQEQTLIAILDGTRQANAQATGTAGVVMATESHIAQATANVQVQLDATTDLINGAATQVALATAIVESHAQSTAIIVTATQVYTEQQAEIARLEEANATLQAQSDAAALALQAQVDAATDDLEALQNRVDNQASTLEALEDEIAALEANNGGASFPAAPPSRLADGTGEWQAAVDELESAGVIPRGGAILREDPAPIEVEGQDAHSIVLDDADTAHTNVVIAAEISPAFAGDFTTSESLEICRLIARIVIEDGTITQATSAILANDGYFFAADDSGDADTDFTTFGDTDLGIQSGRTYHLLMILIDDEMTVYIDGELVLDRAPVTPRRGEVAGVGNIGTRSTSSCTFENIWVYSLD